MPLPPTPEPPGQPDASPGGTAAARIWDAVRKLAAIAEHFRTLEREDARLQSQLLELTRIVLGLSNDVHEVLGQMKAIEKRFDDRDRLLEATIKLRITEDVQKLKAGLHNPFASKDTPS
jgi:predicted  nucleic acid-binding Zn-ribbon protein